MDKRRKVSGNAPAKEDRRVARSRKALSDAFVSLLLEKGYACTSIQDIVERADVGRSTFYEHFENKEQLMLWGHEHLKALVLGHPEPKASPSGTPRLPFLGLYAHLAESRPMAQALGKGPGADIISGFLRDTLRRNLEFQATGTRKLTVAQRSVLTLKAEAAAAGLVAVLWRWVKQGMTQPPQAMADFCDEYLAGVFGN